MLWFYKEHILLPLASSKTFDLEYCVWKVTVLW